MSKFWSNVHRHINEQDANCKDDGGEVVGEKRVTLEEVLAARTPRGGWTKKQLAEWGVDWPPTIGWIKRLTGDPNANVPMPGRTPVAMQLARKTRLQLEQENVRMRAALEEVKALVFGANHSETRYPLARAALEGK